MWAALIWVISVEEVELELNVSRWVGFSAKRRRRGKRKRELTPDGTMSEVSMHLFSFSSISFASISPFFCLCKACEAIYLDLKKLSIVTEKMKVIMNKELSLWDLESSLLQGFVMIPGYVADLEKFMGIMTILDSIYLPPLTLLLLLRSLIDINSTYTFWKDFSFKDNSVRTSDHLHNKYNFNIQLIVRSCDGLGLSEMMYQMHCLHCLNDTFKMLHQDPGRDVNSVTRFLPLVLCYDQK